MTKPDHTLSSSTLAPVTDLCTELDFVLSSTKVHEHVKDRLIRLAAQLQTQNNALRAACTKAQKDADRFRGERDSERRRRVNVELKLSDAANHRDSLADLLERRRLEREEGTEAPMFSAGRDNRSSEPPEVMR